MSRKLRLSVAVPLALVVLAAVGAAALWKYHEQPQFCATCHIMQPYLESWNGSDHLAHSHAEEDVACLDCHEPTLKQQFNELVVYLRGDYSAPLRERKVSMEQCLKCHEHDSYDQIIELTANLAAEVGANPHDSHHAEMECRLCHKMHRQSEDYCAQCHTWGWEVP